MSAINLARKDLGFRNRIALTCAKGATFLSPAQRAGYTVKAMPKCGLNGRNKSRAERPWLSKPYCPGVRQRRNIPQPGPAGRVDVRLGSAPQRGALANPKHSARRTQSDTVPTNEGIPAGKTAFRDVFQLTFSSLFVGTNSQVQLSPGLNSWTNWGLPHAGLIPTIRPIRPLGPAPECVHSFLFRFFLRGGSLLVKV